MNSSQTKLLRVLGIAPSVRGIGFVVMEGKNTLIDGGVKKVKGDKNARSRSNVASLVELYRSSGMSVGIFIRRYGCVRYSRIYRMSQYAEL